MKAATPVMIALYNDVFISIHAAREGGDRQAILSAFVQDAISIHAAREGGDTIAKQLNRLIPISIHAAREGGDCQDHHPAHRRPHFNPRRP